METKLHRESSWGVVREVKERQSKPPTELHLFHNAPDSVV